MKKILTIWLILILVLFSETIYAEETNQISNTEILEQQQQELGISDFIESSKKYTKGNLEEININEIFNSAITGKIGNTNLFNNILNLLGKEFKSTISTIRNYTNNNYYT